MRFTKRSPEITNDDVIIIKTLTIIYRISFLKLKNLDRLFDFLLLRSALLLMINKETHIEFFFNNWVNFDKQIENTNNKKILIRKNDY